MHHPFAIITGSIGICILTILICIALINNHHLSGRHLTIGAFVCFSISVFCTTLYLIVTVKNSNSLNQKLINRLNSDKEKLFFQLLELKSENRELQKEKELREHLLNVVSHDIKGPVKNLLGIISLAIEEDIKPESLTPILKKIFAAVKYNDLQLENLLSWTESNLKSRNKYTEPINIKILIDKIITEAQYLTESKQIRIISTIDNNLSIKVDHRSLMIVINNLIGNSIKFSTPNQEITISAIQSNEFVRIEISDCGIGIPKDILDTIFLPTTKKIRIGTNKEKGTGIGLLLCKKLIEDQQGTIWARSKEGQGSTFCIELPSE